jgi:hypothetical protein
LDFWMRNITDHCGATRTDVNYNDYECTREWRANTSLAFWVDASNPNGMHPGWFNSNGVLVGTDNATFLTEVYRIYLQRPGVDSEHDDPQGGFAFWLGILNSTGNPASYDATWHVIDGFVTTPEYELRFGPQS